MPMDKLQIVKLREMLGINQAQLASMLSVTQASVARWESENNPPTRPSGDAARKLEHLQAAVYAPGERRQLIQLLRESGGGAAVAGLLTVGTSVGGLLGFSGIGSLFGPLGIAGGAAAGILFKILSDGQRKTNNKKG